jgi:hypothetical protein
MTLVSTLWQSRGQALRIAAVMIAVVALARTTAFAQTAEDYIETARKRFSVTGCTKANDDEITVCAKSASGQRYRLPLRSEPDENALFAHRKGELPPPSTETKPWAPCGIFEGQRRCNKRDAAHYGYGKGRDPLTVAIKVISAITNPDR